MQAVAHTNDTAQSQLLRRDRNQEFYRIIKEFHQRTGLLAMINISFNMHEQPIVC